MMDMTDLIEIINENPEIQQMIEAKMQEKQNAAILAQEDELTMKIAAKSAEIEELQSKIEKFQSEISSLEDEIAKLDDQRAALHEQHTNKHDTKTTKHISSKYVHGAYECLCDILQSYPCTNEFKRFDNLIRGRCKKATLLASKWTKADVIEVLLVNKYTDIVDRIK